MSGVPARVSNSTVLTLWITVCVLFCECLAVRPNVVFILADDLGWNDVGFHGSNQIPTPNIDALAYSGLILHNYYVAPICTPSRAALMTGKYPMHTGMQHGVIYGTERFGLPLTEKILPEYLKDLGYKTHLIGKWHLGHYKKEYLPLNRGFDTHLGHWTGKIDLYDHTNAQNRTLWGFDFRRGYNVAHDLFGQYATDVYTKEAIEIIKSHDKSTPLFLMMSHSAVHSGNPYEPLRAPEDLVNSFSSINDHSRRKFAGVLSKLDESVGRVTQALQAHGLLENSLIIFSTDNGGPAAGFNENAASNFPLRGVKNTLWEGGVRGAGFMWSPLLEKKSRVATQKMHIVDWLPTILSAIGGNTSVFAGIDGINQWNALSMDLESERKVIVHNIDDIFQRASITVGEWKLHKGTTYNGSWDLWYGPSGHEGNYTLNLDRPAAKAVEKLGLMPSMDKILQLREAATVKCNSSALATPCKPMLAPCLFNIELDPCEYRNVAELEPEILQKMLDELYLVNSTAVTPKNLESTDDPFGDPKYWGQVFTNFGDYRNRY